MASILAKYNARVIYANGSDMNWIFVEIGISSVGYNVKTNEP